LAGPKRFGRQTNILVVLDDTKLLGILAGGQSRNFGWTQAFWTTNEYFGGFGRQTNILVVLDDKKLLGILAGGQSSLGFGRYFKPQEEGEALILAAAPGGEPGSSEPSKGLEQKLRITSEWRISLAREVWNSRSRW